jgi:hypothetical protein
VSGVTIRVWNGETVCGVFTVGDMGGSSFIGAVGGAANSTRADIELDPWAGLIVDHRIKWPTPAPIRGEDRDQQRPE